KQAIQSASEAVGARRSAEKNAADLDQALYLSRIAQAHHEVQANRPADALKRLHECSERLRGWEWHHLLNRCYSILEQNATIPGNPRNIELSPNGRDLAFVGEGLLQFLEIAPSGELQANPVLGSFQGKGKWHRGEIFSPDGTQAALIGVNTNFIITLMDVASGREIQTFTGDTNRIHSVVFHPREPRIASVANGEPIRIWDVASGKAVRALPQDIGAANLAYSPDGNWLAASAWNRVIIFDVRTGEERCRVGGHLTPIQKIVFSPDSRRLLSVDNTVIRFWEIPGGRSLGALEGHKAWVTDVAFSPDGTRLASGGIDRQIKIWDWTNRLEMLSLTGHSNSVASVGFAPRGHLISTDENGVIKIWDTTPSRPVGSDLLGTLSGHTNRIWSLAFLRDGRLLSSGEDGRALVWDLAKGQPLRTINGIFDVGASADQRYVLTVHGENPGSVARILDAHSFNEQFRASWGDNKGSLFCADLSPDGNILVAGGYAHVQEGRCAVLVWDLRNRGEPTVLATHQAGILDVHFSSDGRYLASASEDGEVKVWDAKELSQSQEGRVLWPRIAGSELPKIAFSPDGKRIATGDGFNGVAVLDVETGETLLRLQGHGEMVTCVDFSPDGKYLASSGADATVRLWDARSGKHLHTYLGHTSIVNALAFSADSRILASGGQDQVIQIWRVEGVRP
ncbi:MAG: WD40 repeat domain-containing protein, partial [Verrucomicrobia bacterium]|nr:WD40 repeat domain-containing protein [Verrucomicrobiota bacterium]